MATSFTTIIQSLLLVFAILQGVIQTDAKLSNSKFYSRVCPNALPVIRQVVQAAIVKEPRMGASLLRLHFHDCFVNGCDASVLLDKTSNIDSEKDALPNANSLRGFGVIDKIKAAVNKACGSHVVSCADILAVAARDSVVKLGGAWWDVELGRRDSVSASRNKANADLPTPLMNMDGLRSSFKKQGLDETDLVALSGAHTIGVAQCFVFRSRLYNETANIDPTFANSVKRICPRVGKNSTLFELDSSPTRFDTAYFTGLVKRKGLLHSDQVLFKSGNGAGLSSSLVKKFSNNRDAFSRTFQNSMLKMGRIRVLTGRNGQIRKNCRRVN